VTKHSPLQLHSPARVWATRFIVIAVAAVAGYLVYEFGRIHAGYNIVDAAGEREAYDQRIVVLENEIVSLKEQVALLETHRDIDREAYTDVETSLTELQAKIQEQRDAIAFYRGIVSPADGNKGLRVQDLKLTRGKAEREYNIRLVLVQALQHDRKVSGNVNVTIDGDQDGVETTYTYAHGRFRFAIFRISTGRLSCRMDLRRSASISRFNHEPARSRASRKVFPGLRARVEFGRSAAIWRHSC
jgi:cell division protein FtsB